jgi:hypothetical protein
MRTDTDVGTMTWDRTPSMTTKSCAVDLNFPESEERHMACSNLMRSPKQSLQKIRFRDAMKGKFSKMAVKLMAAAVVAIGAMTFTSSAKADEPVGAQVDWMKGLYSLDRLVRGGSETRSPAPSPTLNKSAERPTYSSDPNPQNLGSAWFGVAPKMSLVLRDWASSTRLYGDSLSVVEQLRLVASTRMVVTRARLATHTRFTPFVQLGVGQWRVDRRFLPFTPDTEEVATQVGTGFELRLTRRWQLAAEATFTSLIREGQNNSLPQTAMMSTYLASRVEF